MSDWFTVADVQANASPALLLFLDRIRENVRRMIAVAGSADRLRPHMKTHKLAEVIRLQMGQGITKFKCATIAETEMTAACGATDVLLAYQPVGPNVQRVIQLISTFPRTRISVVADEADAVRALSAAASASVSTGKGVEIEVLLDLDVGQHRTGMAPGPDAVRLYQMIASAPGLKPGGLHAYDGHIHDSDISARSRKCEEAFTPVTALRQQLLQAGLPVPRVVAGGTPTFPMHAKRGDVECSPGTCVLWDAGYATHFPDLDFQFAAVLLTRVVGKPTGNRLCLDLGHKSVASEMPQPRVKFLNLSDATIVGHNEEHMVVETPLASTFKVGACLYALPWHVCPTVALHSEAIVIESGKAAQRWRIVGRERRLTI